MGTRRKRRNEEEEKGVQKVPSHVRWTTITTTRRHHLIRGTRWKRRGPPASGPRGWIRRPWRSLLSPPIPSRWCDHPIGTPVFIDCRIFDWNCVFQTRHKALRCITSGSNTSGTSEHPPHSHPRWALSIPTFERRRWKKPIGKEQVGGVYLGVEKREIWRAKARGKIPTRMTSERLR